MFPQKVFTGVMLIKILLLIIISLKLKQYICKTCGYVESYICERSSQKDGGIIEMDIWEKLYQKAKEQYHPQEVSPFIYAASCRLCIRK